MLSCGSMGSIIWGGVFLVNFRSRFLFFSLTFFLVATSSGSEGVDGRLFSTIP